MKNFWVKLKKPIYALAPMAGITDSAFRQVCRSFGADVVYSEMISATAIVYNSQKTLELMQFGKIERPYVIQLFGSKPEHFAYATKFITRKIKPDGIDINFGCPVKKIAKQGAGAVLMNDINLSRKIIKAVIDNTKLPVSIKCRSRVDKIDVVKFLDNIKDLPVSAVMIHGRTLNQGHKGPVDWSIIKKARQHFSGIILANGGVIDRVTARELLKKTGADGLGIGRGALGRPWVFDEVKSEKLKVESWEQIKKIILQHAKLMEKLKGRQGIVEMRKHLCGYACGLPDAKKLRQRLVKVETLSDIKNILQ